MPSPLSFTRASGRLQDVLEEARLLLLALVVVADKA
jgi:hypothetical protein